MNELTSAAAWINVPPVFIVGAYRSGTSLLRLMLCAHPNIWISGEGAYVYGLRDKLNTDVDYSDPKQLKELHEYILPFLQDEKWISLPAVEDLMKWTRLNGIDFRSIMTFYNTWDARRLEKEDLLWWGDNAPYHIFNIPYFDHIFPQSKYIHMVRDPRDVYTSIKFNYKEVYALHDVLTSWQRSVFNGLLAEILIGPKRFLRLKYETLVSEPEHELIQICDFLQVPYAPEMLHYYESKAAGALSQLVQHKNVVKPVFASSVGKFRRLLTQEEISQANDRFGPHMRCLGYLTEQEYLETIGIL